MASNNVGVIWAWNINFPTNRYLICTILPDDDAELALPDWKLGGPSYFGLSATYGTTMTIMPRSQYQGYASFTAFQSAIFALPLPT